MLSGFRRPLGVRRHFRCPEPCSHFRCSEAGRHFRRLRRSPPLARLWRQGLACEVADARGPRCLCEEADGSGQVTSRLPTLRVARGPGGSDRAPRPRSAPLFQACVCVWGEGGTRACCVRPGRRPRGVPLALAARVLDGPTPRFEAGASSVDVGRGGPGGRQRPPPFRPGVRSHCCWEPRVLAPRVSLCRGNVFPTRLWFKAREGTGGRPVAL